MYYIKGYENKLKKETFTTMAKLTDEQIWNMTTKEADAYTNLHPEEKWHFARIYLIATMKQIKKAIKHKLKKK